MCSAPTGRQTSAGGFIPRQPDTQIRQAPTGRQNPSSRGWRVNRNRPTRTDTDLHRPTRTDTRAGMPSALSLFPLFVYFVYFVVPKRERLCSIIPPALLLRQPSTFNLFILRSNASSSGGAGRLHRSGGGTSPVSRRAKHRTTFGRGAQRQVLRKNPRVLTRGEIENRRCSDIVTAIESNLPPRVPLRRPGGRQP